MPIEAVKEVKMPYGNDTGWCSNSKTAENKPGVRVVSPNGGEKFLVMGGISKVLVNWGACDVPYHEISAEFSEFNEGGAIIYKTEKIGHIGVDRGAHFGGATIDIPADVIPKNNQKYFLRIIASPISGFGEGYYWDDSDRGFEFRGGSGYETTIKAGFTKKAQKQDCFYDVASNINPACASNFPVKNTSKPATPIYTETTPVAVTEIRVDLGRDNVMRPKEEGTEVCDVQKLLKEAGYYTGKITCNFGPRTVKSVRSLQEDNEMEATGKITSKLLRILYTAANSQD
jgi:hypothetical protein